jgi:hypothetical protein
MGISPSQNVTNITRSEYVGKDFDTYRQEIIDNLNLIFGKEVASNIVASEQGVMLIEVFAFGLSTLSFYLDRQADEVSFDIPGGARIRANAVAIARILGYSPFAAVPPVIEITMTIDAPFDTAGGGLPSRLTLEKGRTLVGPGGLIYEMLEEVIFESGAAASIARDANPTTFIVREGITFSQSFTSDGLPNQRFTIQGFPDNQNIAEATLEIRVAGILWETVDFLTYETSDSVEQNTGQDPAFIRFGDGIAGNIPQVDAAIALVGFATSGPEGSVTSNTVTEFTDDLVAGVTTVTATLVHDAPSTAGSFQETINSIKTNAPLVFQAAGRAVTTLDLDGLINSFVDATYGAVAKGRATTPRSAAADAQLQTHIAQITSAGCVSAEIITDIETYWDKVLSSNCKVNAVLAQIIAADAVGRYVPASVGLARALETYLDGLVESTVKVYAVDGSVNVLLVTMLAQIKVTAALSTPVQSAAIQTEVEGIIQTLLLSRDYGISLHISDLVALIEVVTGVDYVNLQATSVIKDGSDVSATNVDTFGNIIVGEFEVITMGNFPAVTILEG